MVAVQHPAHGAGTDEVEIGALAPLAAWVRRTDGEPALLALCRAAAIEPDILESGTGRLPLERFEAFLAALQEHLGSGDAFLAALEEGGPVPAGARWLRWFATPRCLYRSRARARWVTSGAGRISGMAGGLGWATLHYTSPDPGGPLACLFRQVRLMQLPTAWDLPSAVVRETRCLARGDDGCVYTIHWQGEPRGTPTIIAAGAILVGLGWTAVPSWIAGLAAVLGAGCAHALETRRVQAANRATDAVFGHAFREAAAGLTLPARGDEPTVTVAAPQGGSDEGSVLRQEGNLWRMTFEGRTVLVRTSRGLTFLVHLLRNPGVEMHVSTLDALSPSDGALPTRPGSTADLENVRDLGDAGEILDAEAKAEYRQRLGELRAELEDAEACNDIGRAATVRAELDAIVEQLREATGLGGRSRRAASHVERMRVAVTRRIRSAIGQIARHHPALGTHLTACVHTGYSCSYEPKDGRVWQT